jgi:hypothetical protein
MVAVVIRVAVVIVMGIVRIVVPRRTTIAIRIVVVVGVIVVLDLVVVIRIRSRIMILWNLIGVMKGASLVVVRGGLVVMVLDALDLALLIGTGLQVAGMPEYYLVGVVVRNPDGLSLTGRMKHPFMMMSWTVAL